MNTTSDLLRTPFDELAKKVCERTARIGVVGMGYVGWTVAYAFAQQGFDVYGLDRNQVVVRKVNEGVCPMGDVEGIKDISQFVATTDYNVFSDQDVIIIAVDTPVGGFPPKAGYENLRQVLFRLMTVVKSPCLFIVESTTHPGCMQDVVLPFFTEAKKVLDVDYFLGNCPERLTSGALFHNLATMPRVIGGMDEPSSKLIAYLYRHICQGEFSETDCTTAELVKCAENAYRDVQIAFANELAMICEMSGVDFFEAQHYINQCPGRDVLMPGGVGGHCIPKDTWLLNMAYKSVTIPRMMFAARSVNDYIPAHVFSEVKKLYGDKNLELLNILILGVAYRENTADARNSPSVVLKDYLESHDANVVMHDPFVPEYDGNVYKIVQDEEINMIVLMVAHDWYCTLNLNKLEGVEYFYDVKGVFRNDSGRHNFFYRYFGG